MFSPWSWGYWFLAETVGRRYLALALLGAFALDVPRRVRVTLHIDYRPLTRRRFWRLRGRLRPRPMTSLLGGTTGAGPLCQPLGLVPAMRRPFVLLLALGAIGAIVGPPSSPPGSGPPRATCSPWRSRPESGATWRRQSSSPAGRSASSPATRWPTRSGAPRAASSGTGRRPWRDLDRAIAIDPGFAQAYCRRAFARQQSGAEGCTDLAAADADRAIALEPSMPLAYIIRGNASIVRGRFGDALADSCRAIALNPKSYAARGCRARARAGLGDVDGAEADIEAALTMDPPPADRADLSAILSEIRGNGGRIRGDSAFPLEKQKVHQYYLLVINCFCTVRAGDQGNWTKPLSGRVTISRNRRATVVLPTE